MNGPFQIPQNWQILNPEIYIDFDVSILEFFQFSTWVTFWINTQTFPYTIFKDANIIFNVIRCAIHHLYFLIQNSMPNYILKQKSYKYYTIPLHGFMSIARATNCSCEHFPVPISSLNSLKLLTNSSRPCILLYAFLTTFFNICSEFVNEGTIKMTKIKKNFIVFPLKQLHRFLTAII